MVAFILGPTVALSVVASAVSLRGVDKLWDPETRGESLPKERYLDHTLRNDHLSGLAFSPDGRFLATGGQDIRLWNPQTRKLIRCFGLRTTHGFHRPVFSPDGRFLFTEAERTRRDDVGECHDISVWEVATGKLIRTFQGHHGGIASLAVAPDGKTLVSGTNTGGIHVWDLASGRELRCPYTQPDGRQGGAHGIVAFSQDGKLLATLTDQELVRLWDVASGREIRQLTCKDLRDGILPPVVFAPDGQTIAAAVCCSEKSICLWDVRSGQVSTELITGQVIEEPIIGKFSSSKLNYYAVNGLAYSPDSKLMACCGLDSSGHGTLRMWEVATGAEVVRWNVGQGGGVVAFSPDGRTLAVSTGNGGVALVEWGCASSADPRLGSKPSSEECLTFWNALKGRDVRSAYRAVRELIARPGPAVKLLSERLPPIPAVSPARLARLIAELDDGKFSVREHACSELARLAESAEPALRKALSSSSPEVRRRSRWLLERLALPPSQERLGYLRAVIVLEYIGTPEARRVLERLAAGMAGARETEDARRACLRLGGQAKAMATRP